MAGCVLAYSGGLDTSVILGWLIDQGYDVHAVYVDLGQPCEDREGILRKAREIGAASARIVDAAEELCRDFAFPVLQWQARYEQRYLLGTAIARPVITKACLQVARRSGGERVCPWCHGQGQRPMSISISRRRAGPRDPSPRALADGVLSRVLSRSRRDD